MRYTLFTLLLLSHTIFAHAAENVGVDAIQTAELSAIIAQPAVTDMDQADAATSAAESEPHLTTYFHNAYEKIIGVIPAFGQAAEQVPQLEEHEQKNTLNQAVLKFASMPRMRSSIVLIYDENGKQALHSKNADVVAPIASITKLMTAMVVLDAKLPLDEEISLSPEDINRKKRTRSRTRTGMTLTRGELLKLALMASDNLSAAALARTYPGGTDAALAQMNNKARALGMNSSRFLDPTGLSSGNVSTANDLVKMVRAAQRYELIQRFSTSTSHTVELAGHRPVRFHNTNPLVKNASWDIGLSKTGYISEAGRCLVMEATITEHPVIIVLLDSWGRNSRVGDANRVKKWMENASMRGRESKNM